jgi:hypothetical protein
MYLYVKDVRRECEAMHTGTFHLLGNAAPSGGQVVAVSAAGAVEVDEPHVVAL